MVLCGLVRSDFAEGLISESDLVLRNGVIFERDVDLPGAKIAGNVAFSGVTVTGTLNAVLLQAGTLGVQSEDDNEARLTDVNLIGAKIAGTSR